MNVISRARKAALAAGAVTVMASAAVTLSAASASAHVPQTFKVCAKGNYSAYAEALSVPMEHLSSGTRSGSPAHPVQPPVEHPGSPAGPALIHPGKCLVLRVSGDINFTVRGVYNNNHSQSFYVGTAHVKAATGWTGAAEGRTGAKNSWLVDFH